LKRSVVVNRIQQILREAILETDEALANRILDVCLMSGMQLPTAEINDPEFPEMANYRWSDEETE
jgi:hypothetical protein